METRPEKIAVIVARFRAALDEGEDPDPARICAAHADLLPELKAELEKSVRVYRARVAAMTSPNADGGAVGMEAAQALAAEFAKPKITVPGYSVIRELGRGGQAVVLLAIQLSTGRKVAVKVMREGPLADERSLTRFSREVEALAALNHPNIVSIIDTGLTADGSRFISMNYIAGSSLEEYMKYRHTKDPDDPSKLLRLFLKICAAVNVAHTRGIIHRDLKPSNIRIDERGEPHILDFGLARTAMDRFIRGEAGPVSITGEFLGSLPWSSPEQAEGNPDRIDVRTDVYSLGVILYQILTCGNFPYEVAGNIRDILNNILTAQPTRPSVVIAAKQATRSQERNQRAIERSLVVNEAIEKIVLKALAKKREARYQNAGELGRDVANYLSGQRTSAPAPTAERPARLSIKHIVAIGAASALVTVGIVLFAIARHNRNAHFNSGGTSSAAPAASAATVAPAQNQTHVVDLMPMFDPDTGAVRGKWIKTAAGLEAYSNFFFQIRAPYKPPTEYDYHVHFTVRSMSDRHSGVTMLMPYGSDVFSIDLAAAGSSADSCVSIRQFPEDFSRCVRFRGLQAGEGCDVVAQVRVDQVRVYVNGQLSDECHISPGTKCGWVWPYLYIGDNVVGLGAAFDDVLFDAATLVELNGPGTPVTPSPSPGLPIRSGSPPSSSFAKVVDLMPLIDPAMDTIEGKWVKKQGKLTCEEGAVGRLHIPYSPPPEYDLRVTFRKNGDRPLSQILSHAGHTFEFAICDDYDTFSGFKVANDPSAANAFVKMTPPPFNENEQHTAVAYVRNDGVWATIDGKLVAEYRTSDFSKLGKSAIWRENSGALGLTSVFGGTSFYAIEIAEVGGAGTSVPHFNATAQAQRDASLISADAAVFAGHHFKFFADVVEWGEAEKRCQDLGGRLASPHTREAEAFLQKLKGGGLTAWVGGSADASQKWIWTDGKPIPTDQFSAVGNDPGFRWLYMMRSGKFGARAEDGKLEGAAVPAVEGYICEWDK